MSIVPAFNGDPALKAQALADAAAVTHPGWISVATDAERQACAEAFGLSPALVALLSCAPNVPHWPGATERLTAYLTAIPVGCDSLGIARAWAAARWSEGPYDIADRLAGTPAAEPAQRIFEAAEAAAADRPSPRQWRTMRSALAAVEDLSPTARAFADVAEALAWDDSDAIGVYVDVWKAWQKAILVEKDQAAGWDQATQDEVVAAIREAHVAAQATVRARFGDATPPPESQAAQAAEAEAVMKASPLAETFVALQAHWNDVIGPAARTAHEAGLDSILEACRAGLPAISR